MNFADTSAFVALHSRADAHHADAVALWGGSDARMLTSNHVLGETWTFVRRKAGHAAAKELIASIKGSARITIVTADEPVEAEAWRWLDRHDERSYSFVDATSFALMRRNRLRNAFAFDGDFSAAGFVELRP